ncbi:MAG TPA: transposase [Kiloniellales bacterium]|jgi:transposase
MILYPELIWAADMGRAYGLDLRHRVIEAIDGGMSARGAPARFSVAPSTAINWHRQWRETGSLNPAPQGQPPGSKLGDHETFILALLEEEKDIAPYEIAEKLAAERGVDPCAATIWYFFSKRGLTHKKRQALHRNSSARTSSPGSEKPPPEPWTTFGRPSHRPSMPSHLRNVRTSSPPQDMTRNKLNPL